MASDAELAARGRHESRDERFEPFEGAPGQPSRRRWWPLGTALLNTLYASEVASFVVTHHLSPSAFNPLAAIRGYHVALWIGPALIAAAFLTVLILVAAGKEEIARSPGRHLIDPAEGMY